MSGGYRKVTIGRHWNRPKPKIYDSNYRDYERMYQDTYKDYSSTKSYINENKHDWNEMEASIRKEIDDLHKYGSRGSTASYSSRFQHSESPLAARRASATIAAQDAGAESSYLRSRLEAAKEKNYLSDLTKRDTSRADDSSSLTTSVVESTTRAASLPRKAPTTFDVSQDEEMAMIEKRLLNLRKLREDLGLPSEVGSDPVPEPISARGREIKANMGSSSARSSSLSRSADTYGSDSSKTEDYSSTRRSARATAAAAAASGASSKLTNGRSSLSRETESKYSVESSPRLAKSTRFDDSSSKNTRFDDSSSKSMKSAIKSSKKETRIADDFDSFDDDSFMKDLRKKLPTSQEILDKIKDMDL